MPSTQDYLQFILDQLSGLGEVSSRAMMGEFIVYYRGKIVGGVYDDRLLVKPVPAALALVERPVFEQPYAGAKEMLLVEDVDDREFLQELFRAMYPELPERKTKK